jgi:2',3'-cyclic-nucleotide 2'-phosphodiesterase (5'-nucleotidase family)
MFHRFIILLGLCSLWRGPAQADFSLTVLHINDFHVRLSRLVNMRAVAALKIITKENVLEARRVW